MGDGNFGNVVPNSEDLNAMLPKMWHYMEKVKSTWVLFSSLFSSYKHSLI